MRSLLTRITVRRSTRPAGTAAGAGRVTFDECCGGEVCTSGCRSAAHRDRVTHAAYRARF
ncbi:hypothetical protein [Actinomadura sp. HBU206391]|uniref:hypothetical protein n=1 Tax=Actinomadura sp. HBU206391 TaxID=2731692 RepID=UPI001650056F|nr:hypothetical protein [Actinomadura sp. HBU206391]MBC6458602.1 hypothetical protein [Actinomadura sp. HBU206391]